MKTLPINHIINIKYINKIIRNLLFPILFCFSFFYVSAQTFVTSVSSNKIGKNQYVEVIYEISEGQIESFEPPQFKDWKIVSGPNNGSYISNVNGKVTHRTSFSYYLQPQKTGNLTIEGARIKVNGKQISSNAATVKVLNKIVDNNSQQSNNDPLSSIFSDPFSAPGTSQQQEDIQTQKEEDEFATAQLLKPGEDINKKIGNNVLLKVITSKNTCYEGEPIVATYKIYTRLDLINPDFTRRPSFSGFSAYDMEEPEQNYSIEELNGIKYRTCTFRKVQLYPLQSGNLTLDPVELDFSVKLMKYESLNNSRVDPDDPNNFVQKTYILKSPTINISVLPLPTLSKPGNFKGALGSFDISASIDSAEIGKGDAAVLRVKITGNGNFSMVQAPSIQWPAGTEAYEPEEKENLNKSIAPMEGDKTFTYVFLCHQPGKFIIPPIQFSFFDIITKTYKTIQTKPISVIVLSESRVEEQQLSNQKTNWPQVFTYIAKYILPIAVATLILYLFLSFVIRKKRREDSDIQKAMNNAWEKLMNETKSKPVIQPMIGVQPQVKMIVDTVNTTSASEIKTVKNISLPQAEATLWSSDHTIFYRALRNDLLQIMSLAAQYSSDNKNSLLQALRKKGIDNDILQQINILFNECDAAIYAPLAHLFTTERHKILAEAKYLMEKI